MLSTFTCTEELFWCVCVCCSKLNLPRPTAAELAFLDEYISAMKPLAKALNIL